MLSTCKAIRNDSNLQANIMSVKDAPGLPTEVTIWTQTGNDLMGVLAGHAHTVGIGEQVRCVVPHRSCL